MDLEKQNDRSKKKIMYIEPCAGLGNRMSAMVSALYWADRYNMELHIVWKHEEPCAVDYYKIFDEVNGLIVKQINQMGKKQVHIIQFVCANMWLKKVRKKCRFVTCEEIRQLYRNMGMKGIEELIESNSKIYVKSHSIFADEEVLKEKGFFTKIPFNYELKEYVNSIMSKQRNIIGIHIRRTDHVEAINNSPTSMFENRMKEEMDKNQEISFYLATDDELEREQLERKYPIVRRRMFEKGTSRTTNKGMMDAVVDMLCLSMCDKIYGSYGSTFSEWGARIGDIPLEFIVKGK